VLDEDTNFNDTEPEIEVIVPEDEVEPTQVRTLDELELELLT